MKYLYKYLIVVTICCFGKLSSQTLEFSIAFIGNNPNTGNFQVALIATPSEEIINGTTADMGAGFYVPSGITLGNFVETNSLIPATEWSTTSLGSNSNGDAYFISRIEAGNMGVDLNGSEPFQLAIFDIIANPNPTNGSITFIENGDPVFDSLFVENYININLGMGTVNAYGLIDPEEDNINFQELSLKEVNGSTVTLDVFPNPTSDILSFKTALKPSRINILNLSGKQVLSNVKFEYERIDVKSLSSGVYFVEFEIDNNSVMRRFIKQ